MVLIVATDIIQRLNKYTFSQLCFAHMIPKGYRVEHKQTRRWIFRLYCVIVLLKAVHSMFIQGCMDEHRTLCRVYVTYYNLFADCVSLTYEINSHLLKAFRVFFGRHTVALLHLFSRLSFKDWTQPNRGNWAGVWDHWSCYAVATYGVTTRHCYVHWILKDGAICSMRVTISMQVQIRKCLKLMAHSWYVKQFRNFSNCNTNHIFGL